MENLVQNIYAEENESRELVRQLKNIIDQKQDLDEAYQLFLKCSDRKWKLSLENFILSMVTNLGLELVQNSKVRLFGIGFFKRAGHFPFWGNLYLILK